MSWEPDNRIIFSFLILIPLISSGLFNTVSAFSDRAQNDWTFDENRVVELENMENRIVESDIIIREQATLILKNSTLNLAQDDHEQFFIKLEGRSKLIMDRSSIVSSKNFRIFLYDQSALYLANRSTIDYSKLIVNGDGCSIHISRSLLNITAMDIRKLKTLTVEDVSGMNEIEGLRIVNCLGSIDASNVTFRNMNIDKCGSLSLSYCSISGESVLGQVSENVGMRNSNIRNITICSYRNITIWDSLIEHMIACPEPNTMDLLELHNCTTRDLIVDVPTKITIKGGHVTPSSPVFMDNLCTAKEFSASHGCVFSYPLRFSQETEAVLTNITVPLVNATENSNVILTNWDRITDISMNEEQVPEFFIPGLKASGAGRIQLFRTLKITVKDRNDEPVKSALIVITEDISDNVLKQGETDNSGTIEFIVHTATVSNAGTDFFGYIKYNTTYKKESGNKDSASSKGFLTMDDQISMDISLDMELQKDDVEKNKNTLWIVLSIFMIICAVVLVILLISKRRS